MISPLPGVTATKPGSCTQPLPGIDADHRRCARRGSARRGRRRLPRHPQALAVDVAHDLGRQRALPQDLLGNLPEPLLRRRRFRASRQGRLLLDHGPHRRRAERRRATGSAPWRSNPRWWRIRRSPRPRWSASRTRSRANRCSPSWCCAASARRGDKIEAFTKTLRDWVTEQLGAIARPDDIRFADNLPKTRSGKIMRRLLRAIARNEDITQDLSTLENPAIIEQLRGGEDAGAKRRGGEKAGAEEEGRADEEAGREEEGRAPGRKPRREEAGRRRRKRRAKKAARRSEEAGAKKTARSRSRRAAARNSRSVACR